jgi:hypothetical protein
MIKGKGGNLLSRLKFQVTAVGGREGTYPGEAGYITSLYIYIDVQPLSQLAR